MQFSYSLLSSLLLVLMSSPASFAMPSPASVSVSTTIPLDVQHLTCIKSLSCTQARLSFKSASSMGIGASADLKIDTNDYVNKIMNAIKVAKNRQGIVRQAMEIAFYTAQQYYNVIVFNLSQGYDASGLEGVISFQSFNYDGVPYGVWIFDKGTFVNQGDGGYINWAFEGNWRREGAEGKTVVFW